MRDLATMIFMLPAGLITLSARAGSCPARMFERMASGMRNFSIN